LYCWLYNVLGDFGGTSLLYPVRGGMGWGLTLCRELRGAEACAPSVLPNVVGGRPGRFVSLEAHATSALAVRSPAGVLPPTQLVASSRADLRRVGPSILTLAAFSSGSRCLVCSIFTALVEFRGVHPTSRVPRREQGRGHAACLFSLRV